MDSTDLNIVRWMYPEGQWTALGTDPRVSMSEIARKVGLSREAVWSRMRRWHRDGFLRNVVVLPHTELFGRERIRFEIIATDAADAESTMESLSTVDGGIDAACVYGDSVLRTNVYVVNLSLMAEGPSDVHRITRDVRARMGSRQIDGPFPEGVPPIRRQPTSLDWKLIHELRANPLRPLSWIASRLGISTRNASRRRSVLVEGHAIAYLPDFNWSIHQSALYCLFYRDPTARRAIVRWLEDRIPSYLPMSVDFEGSEGGIMGGEFDDRKFVAARLPTISQTQAAVLSAELAAIPGVTRVYNEVWGRHRWFPDSIDRLLNAKARGESPAITRPPSAGRRPTPARLPRAHT